MKTANALLLRLSITAMAIASLSGCTTTKFQEEQTYLAATPGLLVTHVPEGTNTGFPTYGEATTNTIQVYVLGEVHRAGLYNVRKGSTVIDVLNEAGGTTPFAWWKRPYSGIIRPSSWRLPIIIEFSKANRITDETIILADGDQLFLGHEVY